MASIIQLKTGTGSAVPTSLTQGEVAINIDNGLFYFGSGSGNDVKSLDSFTNITASGTISGSSQIIGSTGSFSQTVITLKSGAEDSPFLIKIANSNGQDNKLEMNKDGILKFGALDTLPTAITGGLVYSSSAFYMGL
ncbi:hypothetical protein N9Z72_00330 [Akkermansiaceae bacterium]|nr:hypothetical protein [Akkermansiaceae bacterium]